MNELAAQPAPIKRWSNVDVTMFREEIVPRNEPAVLTSLVADWPAVQYGRRGAASLAQYIKSADSGAVVETFHGDPAIAGRFFYQPQLDGFNFERRRETLSTLIDCLLQHVDIEQAPAIYAGAVPMRDAVPKIAQENALPLLEPSVSPRIWIGNAITVSTHFDTAANIACVIAGRRRFTLFPPEQIENLYVGPLDFTIAGPPVSMVDLEAPDLLRYPRFAQAWATALRAELEPGDAIYIPNTWWHHIKSLGPFNALVNYWWEDAKPWAGAPFDCLIHGLLSIRDLPEPRRKAWRAMFDHLVFRTDGDDVEYLPPGQRGVLGELTPELAERMRMYLKYGLQRR
jgi:hypothetical protein